MRALLAAQLILLLAGTPLWAAGLGTPTLSPPMAVDRFFDPDRLLTTGGVKYSADVVTLEPELGVGYRSVEKESSGGVEESSHHVHAQAGGRLSMTDLFYVSAAAKLPVVTIQSAGRYAGQELGTRQDYDIARSFRNTPAWTGEMGFHLSSHTDLTLYYDQSPVPGWLSAGPQQEERIGTRLILRFK